MSDDEMNKIRVDLAKIETVVEGRLEELTPQKVKEET